MDKLIRPCRSDSRELKLRLKLIFDRSSYNHFVHVYSLSKWMKIVLSHMQVKATMILLFVFK